MMGKEKLKIDYIKIHENGSVAGFTTNTKFFELDKVDIAKVTDSQTKRV